MIERSAFTATSDVGTLGGWVVGDGPPVLLLHGGPGLGYDYMEPLIAELQTDFRVAIFQQRGLEPLTVEGPFTIARAIEDVVCVLDALGWSRALVVGHSWGGHLALRFAAAHPERHALHAAHARAPIRIAVPTAIVAQSSPPPWMNAPPWMSR